MKYTMESLPNTCRVFRWEEDGRRAARSTTTFSRTTKTAIVFKVIISSSLQYLNVYPLQEKLSFLLFVFKTVQGQITESSRTMNVEGLEYSSMMCAVI
jgi:hypothetical protein